VSSDVKNEIDQLKSQVNELLKENEQLKQQQIDIESAKNYYLKIFETFPALIWRSGLDKLCNYFNKTWLDFTGRTFEQEYGNGWAEGVHPDDLQLCIDTYVSSFDKKESFTMHYRMKNANGEYRWIRDIGRPFYDLNNNFSGFIGSCYDVTEERNTHDQLRELNATKDRFFSLIAHDLRSPFNVIMGNLDQLQTVDDLTHDELLNIIKTLNSNASITYSLLENLLTWANSQLDHLNITPTSFKLKSFIDEIVQLIDITAVKKQVLISNKINDSQMICADGNVLKVIMTNLLTNAVKYSCADDIVSITCKRSENWIEISVVDRGIGIDEIKIKKLFCLEENIATPGTNSEKGTGLGLILCREFAKKHGGKIQVQSKVGEGSTFTLSLPY